MTININPDLIETLDKRLAEAIKSKSQECDQYAETLIENAKANPIIDVTVDPFKYDKRVKAREKDKSNKLAGEIVLTQEEKDQAKTDQKLSEYEVKCWDTSDKAIKEVEKGTDPVTVKALDISILTTWPVWIPPV